MRSRIRMVMPEIREPHLRAWVQAFQAVVKGSSFGTLEELGGAVRPRRDKRRISELGRGVRLPDTAEFTALVTACDKIQLPHLRTLLNAARAEAADRDARRSADQGRTEMPIVGDYRDWPALGIHQPIGRLSSGDDVSSRLAAGELPAYVLREQDIKHRTGLRPLLAAAAEDQRPVLVSRNLYDFTWHCWLTVSGSLDEEF